MNPANESCENQFLKSNSLITLPLMLVRRNAIMQRRNSLQPGSVVTSKALQPEENYGDMSSYPALERRPSSVYSDLSDPPTPCDIDDYSMYLMGAVSPINRMSMMNEAHENTNLENILISENGRSPPYPKIRTRKNSIQRSQSMRVRNRDHFEIRSGIRRGKKKSMSPFFESTESDSPLQSIREGQAVDGDDSGSSFCSEKSSSILPSGSGSGSGRSVRYTFDDDGTGIVHILFSCFVFFQEFFFTEYSSLCKLFDYPIFNLPSLEEKYCRDVIFQKFGRAQKLFVVVSASMSMLHFFILFNFGSFFQYFDFVVGNSFPLKSFVLKISILFLIFDYIFLVVLIFAYLPYSEISEEKKQQKNNSVKYHYLDLVFFFGLFGIYICETLNSLICDLSFHSLNFYIFSRLFIHFGILFQSRFHNHFLSVFLILSNLLVPLIINFFSPNSFDYINILENLYISFLLLTFLFIFYKMLYFEKRKRNLFLLSERHKKIRKMMDGIYEKQHDLICNIIPENFVRRCQRNVRKKKRQLVVEQFDNAAVVSLDIAGFTHFSLQIHPKYLIYLLNEIYYQFDKLVELFELEKVKTIGDEYICVEWDTSNGYNSICFGIECMKWFSTFKEEKSLDILGIRGGLGWGYLLGFVYGGRMEKLEAQNCSLSFDILGFAFNEAQKNQELSKNSYLCCSSKLLLDRNSEFFRFEKIQNFEANPDEKNKTIPCFVIDDNEASSEFPESENSSEILGQYEFGSIEKNETNSKKNQEKARSINKYISRTQKTSTGKRNSISNTSPMSENQNKPTIFESSPDSLSPVSPFSEQNSPDMKKPSIFESSPDSLSSVSRFSEQNSRELKRISENSRMLKRRRNGSQEKAEIFYSSPTGIVINTPDINKERRKKKKSRNTEVSLKYETDLNNYSTESSYITLIDQNNNNNCNNKNYNEQKSKNNGKYSYVVNVLKRKFNEDMEREYSLFYEKETSKKYIYFAVDFMSDIIFLLISIYFIFFIENFGGFKNSVVSVFSFTLSISKIISIVVNNCFPFSTVEKYFANEFRKSLVFEYFSFFSVFLVSLLFEIVLLYEEFHECNHNVYNNNNIFIFVELILSVKLFLSLLLYDRVFCLLRFLMILLFLTTLVSLHIFLISITNSSYFTFFIFFCFLNLKFSFHEAESFKKSIFRENELLKKTEIYKTEKEINEKILFSTLPFPIIKKLLTDKQKIMNNFFFVKEGSVCFAILKNLELEDINNNKNGFHKITKKKGFYSFLVCKFLYYWFTTLDRIVKKNNCHKVKSSKYTYISVSGLTSSEKSNYRENIIRFSEELILVFHKVKLKFISKLIKSYYKKNKNEQIFGILVSRFLEISISVGIHTGGFSSGIVGTSKYCCDCFGSCINLCCRLAQIDLVSNNNNNNMNDKKSNAIHFVKQSLMKALRPGSTVVENQNIFLKGKGRMKIFSLICNIPNKTVQSIEKISRKFNLNLENINGSWKMNSSQIKINKKFTEKREDNIFNMNFEEKKNEEIFWKYSSRVKNKNFASMESESESIYCSLQNYKCGIEAPSPMTPSSPTKESESESSPLKSPNSSTRSFGQTLSFKKPRKVAVTNAVNKCSTKNLTFPKTPKSFAISSNVVSFSKKKEKKRNKNYEKEEEDEIKGEIVVMENRRKFGIIKTFRKKTRINPFPNEKKMKEIRVLSVTDLTNRRSSIVRKKD